MPNKIVNCPCGLKQTNAFKHYHSKKHYKYMVEQGMEAECQLQIRIVTKEFMDEGLRKAGLKTEGEGVISWPL